MSKLKLTREELADTIRALVDARARLYEARTIYETLFFKTLDAVTRDYPVDPNKPMPVEGTR